MNPLSELLLKWEDGTLTEEELRALNALLVQPEARRAVAEEFSLTHALTQAMQADQARRRTRRQAAAFETLEFGAIEAAEISDRPAAPAEIYRHASAYPGRTPAWAKGIAVAAMLLAFAAALAFFGTDRSLAQIESGALQVSVVRNGRTLAAAGPGFRLQAGDQIRTAAEAAITLSYRHEATRLQLEPDTEITLNQTDDGKRIELRRGTINAVIAPQPDGEPLVFFTEQALATVVGTELSLSVKSNISRLEVTSGSVRWARREDEKSIVVSAGNYGLVGAGLELVARPISQGPWQSQDIGLAAKPGSARWDRDGDRCRISGGGHPHHAGEDGFHFVYQTLTGDGEIRARVLEFQPKDHHTKAGVVIRESLKSSAPAAFLRLNAARGLEFRRRDRQENRTELVGQETFPYWVRLLRRADTITAYKSPDGSNWTQTGTSRVEMGRQIYIGLGVSSADRSAPSTAVFDHITVLPAGQ